MVATGVFTAATNGVVVSVRNTTVLVLTSIDSATQEFMQFEVLRDADSASESIEVASDDESTEKKKSTQPAPPANRITAVKIFCPQNSNVMALLILVDERRLVHYELDVMAKTLVLKASRSVPRSATCMTISSLKLPSGDTKYVVIIGQKTGDVVAVPFPDMDRDLKTLLGHTTSMVTHMAVNHDSTLLLTADRDEKIRISRFPNTSIIESYCLGHVASLTKIACSTLTPELVVSSSMDNTIKLWKIKTGELIASKVLLPGLEVSVKPLDDAGHRAAKSLINVSLTICPKTNIVAVLVDSQLVLFFEIVIANGAYTLRELVILDEGVQSLVVNEPCELLFTETEILVVSYKQHPFLQLFKLSKSDDGHKLLHVSAGTSAFDDFRSAAAKIQLADEDEKVLEKLEDGWKKKKARIGTWNKKVPCTDE
ncbi:WD repeat protein WDR4 [Plasmopara halstedii]|uniref:WD repeat protein WDR4 n=1 Tax=Plasmopara halstedii TaxID=4781 RepID=A0A0P1AT18_PLAHL|nr:WD repeat protein WDR4 [Plasmopara halstedii]CEG44517.1 WD repeat protein WDR4 [Plasmopara halstedii]|eukprot:XP_024580886.1 WD repeat protein WDR4 [Plasmopara halstedii]